MSEGNGKHPMTARLIIDFDGMHVSVSGPIDNPLLCYGMLECAKQTIAQHGIEMSKKQILPPPNFKAL